MKKAYIIHCWEGYPEYCWYPWAKKQLENKEFKVFIPQMPNTKHPKFNEWLKTAQDLIEPDENTWLIGHSLGCITIMRYLESIDTKIAGAVLVAGFTDDLGFKEISSFFKTPIDFKKIKNNCDNITAIHSGNDPYVDLKYADILEHNLNAKVIVKHNMGHFSGPIEDEKSCTQLPEVLENI